MLRNRSFFENYYNLLNIFLIVSKTSSDSCSNSSTGLWKLHFTCSEEFREPFGKFLIVLSFKDPERKSQIFLNLGRTISAGLSNGLLKSRVIFRGKFIVFGEPNLLFSFLELRAEVYRILEKNYRIVVKTVWHMFSGSFGGKNFSEKPLVSVQFRTLSELSLNYCQQMFGRDDQFVFSGPKNKVRWKFMLFWKFNNFLSYQKSHNNILDFWWEISARLSKRHSRV